MLPLRSPRESPEVSWLEKEVEALVVGDIDVFTDTLFGDKEVFGSDDPEFDVSDMEWPPIESEEPSDAKSEVGETESGVKPKSLRGEQLCQYFQANKSVFPNNCVSISYGGDFCSLPKIRMKEGLPSRDPLVAAKYQELLQKRTFVLDFHFF